MLGPGTGEKPPLGSATQNSEAAIGGAGAAVGSGSEHPSSVHSWTSSIAVRRVTVSYLSMVAM